MNRNKMEIVTKNGFAFCRFTICILFWITFIFLFFNVKWIIFIPFILMLVSGILTVKRAPLILLYDFLFNRNHKKETEILNVNSIRFSHYVGATISFVSILFLYLFKIELVAYIIIGLLTILQTIAAFGFCSAQKLYECLVLGKNCCNLGKRIRGGKCNVR